VEQLKTEIASLHATPVSNNMETEVEHSAATSTPEISDLIADLKRDIATIALEMRKKFQATPQFVPFKLAPRPPSLL